MRQTILLVVFVSLSLVGCGGLGAEKPFTIGKPAAGVTGKVASETPDETASPASPMSAQVVSSAHESLFTAGLISSAWDDFDALQDLSNYDITLTIPSDLGVLEGWQSVQYTNRELVDLTDIYFMLFPNYEDGKIEISEIKVNGQVSKSEYGADLTDLRVPMETPLSPGETVEFEMTFTITLPETMGGNYGLLGYFNDVLVLDTFYPVIPVHDGQAWHTNIPEGNGDLTYLDVSTYQVVVNAPEEMVLVSSGSVLDKTLEGGYQKVSFLAGPSRDFYLAGSERFKVVSRIVGETTINSYAFEEYAEGAELALETASSALQVFETRLGSYPYTEFDIISSPMLALGIEYPGIVGITLNIYDLESNIGDTPAAIMLEGVVAHEVAHQWFYSMVGNDQVNEPWLDEALAQYLTWVYYLEVYGVEAANSYHGSWFERWDRVGQHKVPIGMPAEWYTGIEYGAIVYGRGPLFIDALAEEMGLDSFNVFLRSYFEKCKWQTATTADFRDAAEMECECDLGLLFEEWVYE
jgi:hypothetical protein